MMSPPALPPAPSTATTTTAAAPTSSIPILDLLQASQSPTHRASLLAQLRHALLHTGFLYLRGHGVPSSTIADLVCLLPALFALPARVKEGVALANSESFLGYSGLGEEMTAGVRDGREQFEFATESERRVVADGGGEEEERCSGGGGGTENGSGGGEGLSSERKKRGNESGTGTGKGKELYWRLLGANQWPDPDDVLHPPSSSSSSSSSFTPSSSDPTSELSTASPFYTLASGKMVPLTKAEIRRVITTYIAALTELSNRFLALVAEALEMPSAETLMSFVEGAQHRLKCVHYYHATGGGADTPTGLGSGSGSGSGSVSGSGSGMASGEGPGLADSPPPPSMSSTQGVGPHKDSSGWMTFLLQAGESFSAAKQHSSSTSSGSSPPLSTNHDHHHQHGLQALSKSGVWLPVPPLPDTFVVNMGQAFEVVTSGVCKATTHRVMLPVPNSSAQGEYHRYSVPFFQGVRLDLTKHGMKGLWAEFEERRRRWEQEQEEEGDGEGVGEKVGKESQEGRRIDSPFLRGQYETWGMAQLRTKVRSHRDVGRRFYGEVFDRFVDE